MRRTKLQIVQDVLSALDLSEVTSLGETPEAEQIATLVDITYDEMLGDGHSNWPWLRSYGSLEVTSTPNQMKIPDEVMSVGTVWYKNKEIGYVAPEYMAQYLLDNQYDTDQTNLDSNGAKTDRDPQTWTTFNDTNIVFDAYDGSLVSSLTTVELYQFPDEMTSGSDYPNLPNRFHKTLYHGVLAQAFNNLKGDTVSFNIYNNHYKRGKVSMKAWGERTGQKKDRRKNTNYARRRT